jgi:hypothetical protein
MTIEREALIFLLEQLKAIRHQQDEDSHTVVQLENAFGRLPQGATLLNEYLPLAQQTVSGRAVFAAPRQVDEIIRRLKET